MKNVFQIDLNVDVGEGVNNEADLLPHVSSCNIACGGHAGDVESMTTITKLAKNYNVKVGAHPSFPDKLNFGREIMKLSATELYASLKHQIQSLQTVLHNEGAYLNHIKPHGALYNLAAKDENTANVIIEVIKSMASPIKLYAPFNSVLAQMANQAEIEVVFEAFADRNYNADLSLVSRKNKDAILHEKGAVLSHVLKMVKQQKVRTISGVEVLIKASTFCVHGDTDNAMDIVKYLSVNLKRNDIQIQ